MSVKLYRQGDLLIRPVPSIPAGLAKADHRVLAEGEATGHLHAIADGKATLYQPELVTGAEADELRAWFLLVQDAPVEVTHPEHGTITLPPGSYEVLRQRTYTPQENLRVAD